MCIVCTYWEREKTRMAMPLFVHSNRESLMQILNKVLYSATRMIKMKMKWNWNGKDGERTRRAEKKENNICCSRYFNLSKYERRKSHTRNGSSSKRRPNWHTVVLKKCCTHKNRGITCSDGAYMFVFPLHKLCSTILSTDTHTHTPARARISISAISWKCFTVLCLPKEKQLKAAALFPASRSFQTVWSYGRPLFALDCRPFFAMFAMVLHLVPKDKCNYYFERLNHERIVHTQ